MQLPHFIQGRILTSIMPRISKFALNFALKSWLEEKKNLPSPFAIMIFKK